MIDSKWTISDDDDDDDNYDDDDDDDDNDDDDDQPQCDRNDDDCDHDQEKQTQIYRLLDLESFPVDSIVFSKFPSRHLCERQHCLFKEVAARGWTSLC